MNQKLNCFTDPFPDIADIDYDYLDKSTALQEIEQQNVPKEKKKKSDPFVDIDYDYVDKIIALKEINQQNAPRTSKIKEAVQHIDNSEVLPLKNCRASLKKRSIEEVFEDSGDKDHEIGQKIPDKIVESSASDDDSSVVFGTPPTFQPSEFVSKTTFKNKKT